MISISMGKQNAFDRVTENGFWITTDVVDGDFVFLSWSVIERLRENIVFSGGPDDQIEMVSET